MSWELIDEVLEAIPPDLDSGARLVLLVLAHRAPLETREVRGMRQERLMRETGLGARGLAKALARLRAAGVDVRVPLDGLDKQGRPRYAISNVATVTYRIPTFASRKAEPPGALPGSEQHAKAELQGSKGCPTGHIHQNHSAARTEDRGQRTRARESASSRPSHQRRRAFGRCGDADCANPEVGLGIGWLADDEMGRPVPCLSCKQHLAASSRSSTDRRTRQQHKGEPR